MKTKSFKEYVAARDALSEDAKDMPSPVEKTFGSMLNSGMTAARARNPAQDPKDLVNTAANDAATKLAPGDPAAVLKAVNDTRNSRKMKKKMKRK